MHLVYHPKFSKIIVFNFSWVSQSSREKLKTMVMQNVRGRGEQGALWSMLLEQGPRGTVGQWWRFYRSRPQVGDVKQKMLKGPLRWIRVTFIVQFTSILFLRYVLSAVETRVHKSLIENNLQTLFPSLKRIIRLGPQTSKTSESTASLSLAEQVRRTAGTDYRNSNLGKIPLPDFFFLSP